MLRCRVPLTAGTTALIVLLLAVSVPVSAHGDKEIASGKIVIPAGGTFELPISVHYHRLIGHVRVESPSDASLKVRIAEPDGTNAAPLAEPGQDMTINTLLPCCKGEAWSDFVVLLRNDSPRDVTADVRLEAVHDNLAVAVENAETGSGPALVLMFLVPAALGIYLLRRPYSGEASPQMFTRIAFGAHLALWFTALVLGIYGVFRYGGGFVGGSIAATVDMPKTGHPLLNTHAAILLAQVGLWAVSVLAWAAAARRATMERRRVALLGIGIGFTTLMVFVVWIYEYGLSLVATLMLIGAVGTFFYGVVRLLKADRAERSIGSIVAPETAGTTVEATD